ncbi:MAG: hypothetical protein ACRDE2_04300, partial [Chitinophagaceae bacterium]
GLKPEKPKQQLFGKDMHKYLRESGVEQASSGSPTTPTVKQATPTHPKVVSDSTHSDYITNPAPASLTASPDSSHSGHP